MTDGKPPGRGQDDTTTLGEAGVTPSPDAFPPASRRLGDFEILREIGRGGMGIVYEARQISLRRPVALKVLPPALGFSPQAAQRFEREAHAAALLHHTNIVPVYATGEARGSLYYAMELIEGESLDRILSDLAEKKGSPLMEAAVTRTAAEAAAARRSASRASASTSLSEGDARGRDWFDAVARLIADVADALHHAHGRGIIHRDIKPGNLLLSPDDRLMITDFGLARMTEEPGLTVTGSVLGTPAYMSPEQISPGRTKIDHRTDVYSLGAVLYEMLTLELPFTGASAEEILTAILTKDPRPPRRLNGKVPVDLENICLRALEKDPGRRYQTAGEMALDLRQYLVGGLIAARRAGIARRAWKRVRRHPVAATAIAAAAGLALLGGVTWRISIERSEESLQRQLGDARYAYSQGEYREALRSAELVLAEEPAYPEARFIGMGSKLNLARAPDVLKEGVAAVEADPDDWMGHAMIVSAAQRGAFYGKPLEPHVEAIRRLAPETAEAYLLRSILERSAPAAIALLDRALELDPANADALELRIARQVEVPDFDAALADADRLIAVRPRSSNGRLRKAAVYVALHDRTRALSEAERAVQMEPGRPDVYLQRSDVYRSMSRDLQRALADLDKAIELAPERALAYRKRAYVQAAAGRYREALEDARKVLEIEPDDPRPVRGLIRANLLLGRNEEALRLMEEYGKRAETWSNPRDRAAFYGDRADLFAEMGDHERALADAERAFENDPGNLQRIFARAGARQRTGDENGFQADCDLAESLDLTTPGEIYDRAGSLLWVCGRNERAVAEMARVIELAPRWAEGYWGRGLAYVFLRQFEQARSDYDRCIALGPQIQECYHDRAFCNESLGDLERAFRDADAYVRLAPEDPRGYELRVSFSVSLGRVDEAVRDTDRLIALRPEWASAYLGRAAVVASRPGGCERAREDVEKALALDPNNPVILNTAAEVHVDQFIYFCPDLYDLPTALKYARQAAERDPEGQWHDTLAKALYRSGAYAEAFEHHSNLAAAPTDTGVILFDYADLRFYLAMECWRLGRKAEARNHFDRAAAWMDRRGVKDPAQLRLRQEASALLGLPAAPARP